MRGTLSSDWPLILFLHGSEQRGDDPSRAAGHGPPGLRGEGRGLSLHRRHPPVPAQHPLAAADREERAGLRGRSMLRVDRTGSISRDSAWAATARGRRPPPFPGHVRRHRPDLRDERSSRFGAPRRHPDLGISRCAGRERAGDRVTEDGRAPCGQSGADARLTVYPDLAHDCWTMTYRDSRLYLWFLDHSLPDGPRIAASSLSSDALLER